MEVLKQKQYSPLSMEDEVIEIYIAQSHQIDNVALKMISSVLEKIRSHIKANHNEVYTAIKETKLLSDETKALIDDSVKAILESLE